MGQRLWDLLLLYPQGGEINVICPAITPTLGDELLTNGDFTAWTGDNPDSWNVAGEAGVSEISEVGTGQGHGGAGTGACNLYRVDPDVPALTQAALIVGGWYQAQFLLDTRISGTIVFGIGAAYAGSYNSIGTKTYTNRAATALVALVANSSPMDITIDDVSAKLLSNTGTYLGKRSLIPGTYLCHPTVADNTQAGMDIARADDSNFVRAIVDCAGTDKARLLKRIGGTWTDLTSGNITYGAGKELSVIVYGTLYQLFYDGTQVGTDQTISDAGLGREVWGFNAYAGNAVGLVQTHNSRSELTPSAVAWAELVDLGTVVLCDVAADGTLVGFSGGTSLRSSINEGVNWGFISYDPGVQQAFPEIISAARILGDGNLLVACRNGPVYKSKATSWDTGFDLVLMLTNVGLYIPYAYGLASYQNIVLAGEYGSNTSDTIYAYGSQDHGDTWATIWSGQIDGVTQHHVHNIAYDPYDDLIWLVTGDSIKRMVYYSLDFGSNWTQLAEIGSMSEQFIQIVPLPECTLFLTDSSTVGAYAIPRRKGQRGGYSAGQLSLVWDAYPGGAGGAYPIGAHPVVAYGTDAHAFLSFAYFDDAQAGLGDLYATRGGGTFTKISEAAVDPSGAGTLGVTVIVGPTSAGNLYLMFGKGTAGAYLVRIALPTWS